MVMGALPTSCDLLGSSVSDNTNDNESAFLCDLVVFLFLVVFSDLFSHQSRQL